MNDLNVSQTDYITWILFHDFMEVLAHRWITRRIYKDLGKNTIASGKIKLRTSRESIFLIYKDLAQTTKRNNRNIFLKYLNISERERKNYQGTCRGKFQQSEQSYPITFPVGDPIDQKTRLEFQIPSLHQLHSHSTILAVLDETPISLLLLSSTYLGTSTGTFLVWYQNPFLYWSDVFFCNTYPCSYL